MRSFGNRVLTSLIAISMAACSVTKEAEKAVSRDLADAEVSRAKAAQPKPRENDDNVQFAAGVYLGPELVRSETGDPLPRGWDNVRIVFKKSLTLREFASEVSAMTKIPTVIDAPFDDTSTAHGGPNAAAPNPAMNGGMPFANGVTGPNAFMSANGNIKSGSATDDLAALEIARFSCVGSLYDCLQTGATRFAVQWEYRNGQIRFFRFQTRVFPVVALPSTSTVESNVNSGVSSGSASGSSSGGTGAAGNTTGGSISVNTGQVTKVESSLKLWEEIGAAIRAMLPKGSVVVTSPTAGTVTVSTTPAAMIKVEDYLRAANDVLSKQVAIDIQVLSVSMTASDDYAFDLSAFLSNNLGTRSVSWSGELSDLATTLPLGTMNAAIVGGPGYVRSAGAVIQALSKKYKVSLKESASFTTVSNQAVPFQVVDEDDIVRNVTTTVTGSSGTAQTAVQTDTKVTGFTLNMLPRILNNGRVLLQYALGLSNLRNPDLPMTKVSDNVQVQLAKLSRRNVMQTANLASGETLVLAGFTKDTNSTTRNGVGEADFMGLGGQRSAARERTMIIIILSPSVLSNGEPING